MSALTYLSLRMLLAIDAATCLATGGLLTVAAEPLAPLLALPEPLLFWAGIALLPCGGFMAASAWPMKPPRWAAWFVVVGNGAWVLASLAILLAAIVSPNVFGWLFVLAQAAAVALLGALEFRSLKNDASTDPAGFEAA